MLAALVATRRQLLNYFILRLAFMGHYIGLCAGW